MQCTIACYGARVQSGEKKISFKKTYSLTIYFQNIPNIDKKKTDKSQKKSCLFYLWSAREMIKIIQVTHVDFVGFVTMNTLCP